MLALFLKRSFSNQKKAMFLMVFSVAVGTAMASSLIALSMDVSSKVSNELRAFGANILIEPKIEGLADITGQKRYLRQEDIVKSKVIFWRHNILGVSPFLEADSIASFGDKNEPVKLLGLWYSKKLPLPGETEMFEAGVRSVSPWWNIRGEWPDSNKRNVAVGVSFASSFGIKKDDLLNLDGSLFTVSGIVDTGGVEDNQVLMDIDTLQSFKGLEGKISKVLVSALTTPMDEFAYKDQATMSKAEYEKWYCTGYVTSIAKQLEEVFHNSRVKPIWQVAATEGKVLEKLSLLMYLLCFISLAASALGVSTTMIMSLLRRVDEVGLMKAVGADSAKIIYIFLSEGVVIGIAGGFAGYLLSIGAAKFIGIKVFNTAFEHRAILFPIAIGSALFISLSGMILPIKRALRIKPAVVLKGAE